VVSNDDHKMLTITFIYYYGDTEMIPSLQVQDALNDRDSSSITVSSVVNVIIELQSSFVRLLLMNGASTMIDSSGLLVSRPPMEFKSTNLCFRTCMANTYVRRHCFVRIRPFPNAGPMYPTVQAKL
jgi:hypothetical protein